MQHDPDEDAEIVSIILEPHVVFDGNKRIEITIEEASKEAQE